MRQQRLFSDIPHINISRNVSGDLDTTATPMEMIPSSIANLNPVGWQGYIELTLSGWGGNRVNGTVLGATGYGDLDTFEEKALPSAIAGPGGVVTLAVPPFSCAPVQFEVFLKRRKVTSVIVLTVTLAP